VPLSSTAHSLVLNPDAVAAGAQRDLDEQGIAKNAREEQLQARKRKQMTPEEQRHNEEMARLYRQHVLKEDPNLVSVGMLRASLKKNEAEIEARG
jgi:hypothetical protein